MLKASPTPAPEAPSKGKAGPRRKSAIDTLVARDQTAVFWFLVACAVAGGCAWYLIIMAEALKARPPFVVMDQSGAYYVAPGVNYNTRDDTGQIMNPMHVDLTQLAVRTIFERTPLGLTHADRTGKLFTKKGSVMLDEIIKKEDPYFISQKVEQTVEILPIADVMAMPPEFLPTGGTPKSNPAVLTALPTAVATWSAGIVTRHSVFKGQPQVERFFFKVILFWKLNPDMRGNDSYPSVVDKISTYKLEKISDS
ncbi:MAG: hypothetical protein R3F13_14725 [Prosthecobacter sp.]